MARWSRIALALVSLLVALLVFPNRIPECVGIWLVFCTIRFGWLDSRNSNSNNDSAKSAPVKCYLAIVPFWLACKWPEPTIPLAIFVTVVIAAVVVKQASRGKRLIFVWATWAIWLTHHHLGSSGPSAPLILAEPARPVVCLGDSLTAFGYPQELQKRIAVPVADFGVSGIKTAEGVKLLPEIIVLNPQVVVLELGGHDYNTGDSRATAAANMRTMIEAFQKANATVVIVEIPRGFVIDPWYGFERQLAREYDLQLVPDTMVRRLVYWSPVFPPGSLVSDSYRLSEDGIHPNESGNNMMAETIAGYLGRLTK